MTCGVRAFFTGESGRDDRHLPRRFVAMNDGPPDGSGQRATFAASWQRHSVSSPAECGLRCGLAPHPLPKIPAAAGPWSKAWRTPPPSRRPFGLSGAAMRLVPQERHARHARARSGRSRPARVDRDGFRRPRGQARIFRKVRRNEHVDDMEGDSFALSRQGLALPDHVVLNLHHSRSCLGQRLKGGEALLQFGQRCGCRYREPPICELFRKM